MKRNLVLVALFGLAACGGTDVSISDADGTISVSPELTDLGAVAVGETVEFVLDIDSVEGGDVAVRRVDVTNMEGNYFLGSEQPVVVPSEGAAQVTLVYTPLDAGYHYAIATVVSDGVEPMIDVELRALAVDAAPSVWPAALDFGPVPAGASGSRTVSVANDGLAPLVVEGATFTASEFSAAGLPLTVNPGETKTLNVEFAAGSDLPVSGSMNLDFDAIGASATVALLANDCENGDPSAYDTDGDGYATCGGDCDDTDPRVHPGAPEEPDAVDQDCDGTIDEGTETYDDDGDGWTEVEGDCNDGTATVSPGNPEVPDNGIDDDCDGIVDSGTVDADGDGYATSGGDCNDKDPTIAPGAAEVEDGVDNDCDGVIDEGTDAFDDDGDGVTENKGDCDDTDPTIRPGAPEAPNHIDDDCDGAVDEGTVNADDDGDGFNEVGGDCDDADPLVNPGQLEILGDGIDNDCDGTPE